MTGIAISDFKLFSYKTADGDPMNNIRSANPSVSFSPEPGNSNVVHENRQYYKPYSLTKPNSLAPDVLPASHCLRYLEYLLHRMEGSVHTAKPKPIHQWEKRYSKLKVVRSP